MNTHTFFVSTGRTGTLFLSQFFNQHVPNTVCYHEPKPAFKRRGYELVNRDYTTYEYLYFKSFRAMRFSMYSADYYFEANNCLFSCIDLIREAFPDARIIHIVRDPRQVVRSYINKQKRYADPGESVLTPGHFTGDPFEEGWDDLNPLQKTAWFWLRVNDVIERQNPDETVFFEDLFEPPHTPMKRWLTNLPVKSPTDSQIKQAFQKKIHSSNEFLPVWSEWPVSWKEQFQEICVDKMKNYGYEL